MPEPHNTTDENINLTDEQQFKRLQQYLDFLQAGDVAGCENILKEHPDLVPLLGCLESLDKLASSATPSLLSDADTQVLSRDSELDDRPPSLENSRNLRLGKYELLEEIGRGGMGVVYKARQSDLDRVVAVKMIRSSQLASVDEVRRFYEEAKAAGSLRHPHIVGIHEVGEVHGQHFFAMDYIDGQSLSEILARGPLPSETAAKCLAEVARAVDYLHARQIIHRDLKPQNILIDKNGQPYVTDFGLAKIFQADRRQTQTGTIIGTPSYMSPEQAAGRRTEISACSDIYSLGAILYEMLTGRPPFQEENPLDTLVQVLEGEPTLPNKLNRGIPRDLELICLRCLEKDPNKRYPSAKALADDLDRYLRSEPVEARPSGIGQKLLRWARREPALVSRLAGLTLAATIVQWHYMRAGIDFDFHLRIMGIFGVWAVVSFVFQWLLQHAATKDVARFGWAAADTILLTTMLFLADGPIGPLLIGYPLLIASSGLFFRVRLVWFMTFVSLLSYAALVLLRPEEATPPHYAVIFAAVIAVIGVVVAYQVYRVRALSRYYEHRTLS